jgi:hypothetical protein
MKVIFSLLVAGALSLNLSLHQEKLQLSHMKCNTETQCKSGEKCFSTGQGYGICTLACNSDLQCK